MPYSWLVFLHVASVVGFLLSHGGSAVAAFRLRRESSPDAIRALLRVSTLSSQVMYPFLLLVFVTGVALGFAGHWWGYAWIWTAVALLLLASGVMVALGMPYNRLRAAAGEARGRQPSAPAPPEEIGRMAASTRPGLITALGVVALALLLWLMILKPF
jgi:uncharacterized membrane protein